MAILNILRRGQNVLKRSSTVNWAIVDQTMVSAANFLMGIMLARFLGIEEFGRFTLVWLVAEFLHSIQHSLIVSPLMSIGPKQSDDNVAGYLGAVLAQQISFAAITFTMVIFGGQIANHFFPAWDIGGITTALAFAVLTYQIQNFIRRYLFVRARAHLAFVCDAIRYPGQLVVLLWANRCFLYSNIILFQ